MTDSLVDALEAETGVTCVVGAGGKKSTLYALAARLERAIVTATVRIPPFEEQVADLAITERPLEVARSNETWPLGLVPAREGDDRYRGYGRETVDALADLEGVPILVKADGARTRWFKAPAEKEPQLPSTANTVVPIASTRVVGERLEDEHVHRPERVAAVTELEMGDRISPADVATVLASEAGGCKDVPDGATVVPLLNMADTPELAETAREIAAAIHDRRDVPRVVVTSLLEENPVVDVV
ncbi:selenium cofactor biosynthesis protein YqeC [Natronobacterium texcoconense]|uniref:Probable selenium-dependent hydroxylase accessory protein YqeC n=1 Tax=Natronobacterium texcoconense TaxID=1095778 RepID=A0A1H1IE90_NATTX|nr:selenium cofactor biosynthesis protein YqeC [Natronobacterium texcoconense]SDR36053.1 probable selenium-dependent hydroxylase accessory protein YqeC [Natronobacterium texcoconense]